MTRGPVDRPGPAPAAGAPRFPSPAEAPEISFAVEGSGVPEHAAVPAIRFDLRVDAGEAEIRSLSLNAVVRIVAPLRPYDDAEKARLYEIFGAPRDWGRNLQSVFWTQTSFVVPAFERSTVVELRVPCSYDFDVAANKYLEAVRGGTIPLEFVFSGSVFYRGADGALRMVRLPWDREYRFDMPAARWHEMMERYFPNTAWLRVRRDVFDRLVAYRSGQGLATWEAALEALLPPEAAAPPGEDPS